MYERDRQTGGRTDSQTPHDGIGRAHIAVRNNKTGYSVLVKFNVWRACDQI